MQKNVLFLLFVSGVLFWGCKRSSNNNTTPAQINSVNDIKVPDHFLWESSHNVVFNVQITDQRFGSALHAISIYDGDPYNGGNLVAKGSASTATAYNNTLYLPTKLSQVYVMKTSPDLSKIIYTADVSGASASLSFDAIDPNTHREVHRNAAKITSDCSSGCTQTITTTTSNLNVNNGDVICITGNGITVSFSNINGGTIRVCGANVILQNVTLNGSATLLVTTNGSAIVSGINFNSSSSTLQNDGTITLSGGLSDNGIFTNNGSFTCSGDFNLNSQAGLFTNNGTMTISGGFNNGSQIAATNAGHITLTGNFQQNSGSAAFTNNCALLITGNYTQSAPVKNYSLIKVGGTSTINSSTELDLYNGAMLKTNGFLLDGSTVKGNGSTSLVKINGTVTIMNSGAVLTGPLQICSTNSVDTTKFTNGAAKGCTLYIPVTSCDADGNGSPSVPDADGDGVADNLDDYPNDPAKAHNNYYPSSSSYGTVAFEDNWPAKGDYDMNDLVMGYQYNVVTNAGNAVVQVLGNYTLYATGGNNGNGFAVQFPVAAGSVSGLTGSTLQAGQTNAVVTIFTNMRSEMSQWNTVLGVPYATPKNYAISFNVSSGPSITTFGLNSYDPFIMPAVGKEVHLPGHAPSDLATRSLFGTSDDNTNLVSKTYYLTKTGLPYALDIPIGVFSYPVEDTDITRSYRRFASWAETSGASYTDWYSNTATGYRTTANIYTH